MGKQICATKQHLGLNASQQILPCALLFHLFPWKPLSFLQPPTLLGRVWHSKSLLFAPPCTAMAALAERDRL